MNFEVGSAWPARPQHNSCENLARFVSLRWNCVQPASGFDLYRPDFGMERKLWSRLDTARQETID